MVSIFSFLWGKKKAKGTSSPPLPSRDGPTTSTSATAPSPPDTGIDTVYRARPRPPGRFLSMRYKKSTRPYDLSSRRASSELSRKKSQIRTSGSGMDSRAGLGDLTLPKLDLGGDLLPPAGTDDSMGLGRVTLSKEEKEVLAGLTWDIKEVKIALDVFGKTLRDTGSDIVGIMLPCRLNADLKYQQYLVALFALCTKPELVSSFPSLSPILLVSSTSSTVSQTWNERLRIAIHEVGNPVDLAETIKFILRRSTTASGGIVDDKTYINFVQDEYNLSYPLTAYETLLSPKLEVEAREYLNEMFELIAGLATHAETNSMSSGRLAYLLGWWICRCGDEKLKDWEVLYDNWKTAGKKVEHLLYAWIRYQSTRQQLPIRLLNAVQDYPFGQSSASPEHLPVSPPSTFPRQTLHVSLVYDHSLATRSLSPEQLIKAALNVKLSEKGPFPFLSSLRQGENADPFQILSDESIAFIRQIGSCSGETPPASLKEDSHRTPQTTTGNGPLYRPFSTISAARISPEGHSRQQSQSQGLVEDGSSVALRKHAPVDERGTRDSTVWDDFKKTGFGDSPSSVGELGLAFSPSTVSASTPRPSIPKSLTSPAFAPIHEGDAVTWSATSKRATFRDEHHFNEAPVVSLFCEAVTQVDDIFLPFLEDAQLDSTSIAHWPPFALVRLVAPFLPSLPNQDSPGDLAVHTSEPIEWLLVTVEYRPPPAPMHDTASEHVTRAISPKAASTTSRISTTRGFKDFATSFKRSSSFATFAARPTTGMKRSLFGGSAKSISRSTGGDQTPQAESSVVLEHDLRTPSSAQSLTPTDYTIGEMGEIVKIPSPTQESVANTTRSKQVESVELYSTGIAVETTVSDWAYVAEGAAHIVFGYRGSIPAYTGKVVRFRKPTTISTPAANGESEHQRLLRVWRQDLLHKLLPAHLLASAEEVCVHQQWFKDLLDHADEVRPQARKMEGITLAESVHEDGRGLLMEDITATEREEGIITLAVEIKPKWGFLPHAEHLEPPESVSIKTQNCRYCLHRHYRDQERSEGNAFCPLDLYSGDGERMLKAWKGLWDLWTRSDGKINNLRVFVDGLKVSPDQADKIPCASGEGGLAVRSAPFLLPLLKTSQVLPYLSSLQRNLDPTDISDLIARFRSVYPIASLFEPSLVSDPTVSELGEFTDTYLSNPTAGSSSDLSSGGWTLRQRLIAYSLSAIFKDCSVIVKTTLVRSDDGGWRVVKGEGKGSVKVIDLDLKPIKNLKKWAELDENIWRYWLDTKGGAPSSSDNKLEESSQAETEVYPEEETSSISNYGGDAIPSPVIRRERSMAPSPSPLTEVRELSSVVTPGSAPTEKIASSLSPTNAVDEGLQTGSPQLGGEIDVSSVKKANDTGSDQEGSSSPVTGLALNDINKFPAEHEPTSDTTLDDRSKLSAADSELTAKGRRQSFDDGQHDGIEFTPGSLHSRSPSIHATSTESNSARAFTDTVSPARPTGDTVSLYGGETELERNSSIATDSFWQKDEPQLHDDESEDLAAVTETDADDSGLADAAQEPVDGQIANPVEIVGDEARNSADSVNIGELHQAKISCASENKDFQDVVIHDTSGTGSNPAFTTQLIEYQTHASPSRTLTTNRTATNDDSMSAGSPISGVGKVIALPIRTKDDDVPDQTSRQGTSSDSVTSPPIRHSGPYILSEPVSLEKSSEADQIVAESRADVKEPLGEAGKDTNVSSAAC
ncbi:hypothetical protein IAR55_002928 [Kwoniella newhampshirensis]|uniref:Inositol-pentakisphosphate 2-kinase n=1 Tax=Kwoniella newhampshirensis TaxID=1651941 RepID=A0AAW0YNZ5_9TREE